MRFIFPVIKEGVAILIKADVSDEQQVKKYVDETIR